MRAKKSRFSQFSNRRLCNFFLLVAARCSPTRSDKTTAAVVLEMRVISCRRRAGRLIARFLKAADERAGRRASGERPLRFQIAPFRFWRLLSSGERFQSARLMQTNKKKNTHKTRRSCDVGRIVTRRLSAARKRRRKCRLCSFATLNRLNVIFAANKRRRARVQNVVVVFWPRLNSRM